MIEWRKNGSQQKGQEQRWRKDNFDRRQKEKNRSAMFQIVTAGWKSMKTGKERIFWGETIHFFFPSKFKKADWSITNDRHVGFLLWQALPIKRRRAWNPPSLENIKIINRGTQKKTRGCVNCVAKKHEETTQRATNKREKRRRRKSGWIKLKASGSK